VASPSAYATGRPYVPGAGGVNLNSVIANLIKTAMFTVIVPGTVAVYVPYRLRGSWLQPVMGIGWLGIAPLAAGIAIYLWCAWDFATFGHGTPLPLDAPKQLVVRGLYRYVRNPMYVGVLGVTFGQAVMFASMRTLWYGLAVGLAFHLFVLLYEEPALKWQFGESYRVYLTTVPRWIPRLAATRARVR
jgi:protein-S-isoprenylcysteine O-methyltransferase Ste14